MCPFDNRCIHMKQYNIKGGLMGLLCLFYLCISGFSQSFFFAETTPSSPKYGEVRTTQLSEEIIHRIQDLSFTQAQWTSLFHLKTQPSNPPVIGSFRLADKQIVFKPRFLPDPSVTYLVSFSFEALNNILNEKVGSGVFTETVTFASPASKKPTIVAISPGLDELPTNVLRIYIHFSAPMSFQNPYEFISIVHENGKEVVEPFVIVPEGLWNIDRTRLTLLFHPGRIKRGVGPNMTEGDILTLDNTYQLKINNGWTGSNGQKLDEEFTKTFTVKKSINEKIPYKTWELAGKQGDMGLLNIKTRRPLDQALAKRMLFVKAKDGDILPTNVEFKDPFNIRINWNKPSGSEYELLIDPRLEDICGNTPLNAFDYESGNRVNNSEILRLSFTLN